MNSIASDKSGTNARLKFFDRIARDPGITGTTIKVAWRLVARINNKTGLCCPSIELLVRELGVDERTVRRSVDLLTIRGWFTKGRRGYRGMQYFPNYEWRMDPADGEERTPTRMPGNPDKLVHEPRSGMSAEHITEHFLEPSEEQEGVYKAAALSDPTPHVDPSANATWNAHRAELIEVVGEGDFLIWLDPLTPESDDGNIIVLAAATQFSVECITLNFRDDLERVLGRRVVVVERSWAAEAYRRRRAERAAISAIGKESGRP